MKHNKRVADMAVFEDRINDEEEGTVTLYFHAPKVLIQDPAYCPYEHYPDAEFTDISVEFPANQQEANAASVMFGPIKDGATCDWVDVDLPYEEIEALFRLAERTAENRARLTPYQRYQLQWMLDHGYSLSDLVNELTKVQYCDPEDSDQISTPVSELFANWEADVGFGSEIWACEAEWAECEGSITNKIN